MNSKASCILYEINLRVLRPKTIPTVEKNNLTILLDKKITQQLRNHNSKANPILTYMNIQTRGYKTIGNAKININKTPTGFSILSNPGFLINLIKVTN